MCSPPLVGETCAVAGRLVGSCADPSLTCVPTSESSGVCRTRRSPGESCERRFDCGPPSGDWVCDVGGTNTCVRAPGPGEPCARDGVFTACDPETAWCDESTFTCREHRPVGAPCRSSIECGSWHARVVCSSLPVSAEQDERVCVAYAPQCL